MDVRQPVSERRHHLRLGSYAVICIKDETGKSSWRFVEDISLGGMRIYAERPLDQGDILDMELKAENTGQAFRFKALVAWCDPGVTGRAGLTFVEMEPPMRDWLQTYLGAGG